MKAKKCSLLQVVIKTIGFLVIVLGIGICILDISSSNIREWKFINKKLGSLAEYGAIAAGLLWLLRHLWLTIHKHKKEASHYAKNLYLFVKQYHTLIGYAVFSVASAHGIYFLLVGSRNAFQWYSGITALIGLIGVVLAGVWLQNLKNKKKYVQYRKIHQMVAVLFGIGLILHLIS